jgi:hypothetical protein
MRDFNRLNPGLLISNLIISLAGNIIDLLYTQSRLLKILVNLLQSKRKDSRLVNVAFRHFGNEVLLAPSEAEVDDD